MLEQLLDGRVVSRQFHLGENAVDFPVANGVENRDGSVFTPFQFWGQMMPAL